MPDDAPPSPATLLWEEGRLGEAIAAAEAGLRNRPLESGPRRFLAELLCFAGDLDRAERVLSLLLEREPASPGPALLRNLIAGERRRRAVEEGAAHPALPGGESGAAARALHALGALRDGRAAQAASLLQPDAGATRQGTADGAAFARFRDQDDLFAATLELLTPQGELLWLGLEEVAAVALPPPRRARDLLWRPVQVVLRAGTPLAGFMPALYPNSHQAADPLRLGHATEFREDGPVVRGLGLRLFEIDDGVRTVLDAGELRFAG